MSALVSVLIPAFNAQRWIGSAIECALDQSWPHKEVIVVDDASTDDTLAVARSFAGRGVQVISQARRGAAAARNTALRSAQGSYVQYLDADDLIHPDKLSLQLRGVEAGHRSRTLLTSAWGRFFDRVDHARFVPDSLWQDLAPVDWLVRKFADNKFMFPATWLVSSRLIESAGRWNEDLSFDDDGEYMCRLVAASDHVRFVRSARSYYRIGNSTSLSSQRSDRALESGHRSLCLCIEHLLRLENSDRTRRASVRLLQDNLSHFYPERRDLVERLSGLACSLGGELALPREGARFKVVRRLFGWKTAKQLRAALNNTRLGIGRTMERLPRRAELG